MERMQMRDGQVLEAVGRRKLRIAARRVGHVIELADPLLGCNFPGACRAREDPVVRIGDGAPGGRRQSLVVRGPPQELRIEQHAHQPSSQALSSSSGKGSKNASPTVPASLPGRRSASLRRHS